MNWLQQVYIVFSKSRAPLYHYTPLFHAYKILRTDVLKLGTGNSAGTISFTRNKNFEYDLNFGDSTVVVRFTVDQDKLRHRYKIKPVKWKGHDEWETGQDESEEAVFKPIKNFNSYIESIDMPNVYYRIDDSPYFPFIERVKKQVKKEIISNKLLQVNGLKFIRNKVSGRYAQTIVDTNNEIFYMRYILRHPKFNRKYVKHSQEFIKYRLDFIDSFYRKVGIRK